jgi:hypothetical protein
MVMMRSSRSALEPTLLDSVDYPTDKDDLLSRAQLIDAPEAVLDAIRRLRAGTFRSRIDLVAAVEAIL